MSIVKAIKSFNFTGNVLDPVTYRSAMADMFLAGGQGPLSQFTYKDYTSPALAYQKCPPLTAVINKKAQAYINGKTWVMDKKGKESTSDFANKLREKLAKPNPLQTWKQFEAQHKIYQEIDGFCIVLPIKPVGFKDNIDATSIWNIPAEMLDIEETNKLFYQSELKNILKKITLNYRGERTELQLDQIYIFKDITPSFKTLIFPDSKIRSLEIPISNIIGALESRGVLINFRGALGILSSGKDKHSYIPIKDFEKAELQKDFSRYGLRNAQWKFIITSAMVQWQQIGIPTRELMLFEEIEDATHMICDSYGFPIDLMAGSQRKTYQNSEAARKGLYQETLMPEADNTYEQWNIFWKCAENKVELQKDFSHVPALQKDMVQLAQARYTLNNALSIEFRNNLLTVNRWLELNGEDTLGPKGDVYYYEWQQGKAIPTEETGQEEETEDEKELKKLIQKIQLNGKARIHV